MTVQFEDSMRATETYGMMGLCAIATIAAALTGTLFGVIVSFPFSLIAIIIFPILLIGFILAAVLATPVTLGLFLLAYPFLRSRPMLAQLAFPLIGLVGGGLIICAWIALGVLPNAQHSWELFSAIGMISGLVAGAFFGRGLHA
ncbi:hypothetical protein [Bradyrhizobium sp. CCBAU 11357]|uniref:hypothetical protein n=1 Tax=Bradyrhizobium sp. CCBAU 11357 TaxID=1630808 RepID=UPI0023043016|nr:hypothetical protein [Bradyrhizobium sp. CCBAU 11357]MDA9502802.1 hypothetical protein [Bradyrhizobium sp. CCBAU 11357]